MSPEAQRIAIAEACGWHSFRDIGGDSETKLWGHPAHLKKTSLPTELVPDYLTDLNAMHEAEKVLSDEQLGDYQTHLDKICFVPRNGISWEDHVAGVGWNHDERIYATAAQRAEAFLRTIGKWDDGGGGQ